MDELWSIVAAVTILILLVLGFWLTVTHEAREEAHKRHWRSRWRAPSDE